MTDVSSLHAEVEKAAELAGIQLNEADLALFTEQLERAVMSLVSLLELDVSNVEPTGWLTSSSAQVMREDEPGEVLGTHRALRMAPRTRNGYVQVPPVMKGEG